MLTDCLLSVVLEEKFRDQYLIKAILRKFHQSQISSLTVSGTTSPNRPVGSLSLRKLVPSFVWTGKPGSIKADPELIVNKSLIRLGLGNRHGNQIWNTSQKLKVAVTKKGQQRRKTPGNTAGNSGEERGRGLYTEGKGRSFVQVKDVDVIRQVREEEGTT